MQQLHRMEFYDILDNQQEQVGMQVRAHRMDDGEVHEDDIIHRQLRVKIVHHMQALQVGLDNEEYERFDDREHQVHRVYDHGEDLDEEDDERVMDEDEEDDIHEDEMDEDEGDHIMLE